MTVVAPISNHVVRGPAGTVTSEPCVRGGPECLFFGRLWFFSQWSGALLLFGYRTPRAERPRLLCTFISPPYLRPHCLERSRVNTARCRPGHRLSIAFHRRETATVERPYAAPLSIVVLCGLAYLQRLIVALFFFLSLRIVPHFGIALAASNSVLLPCCVVKRLLVSRVFFF